MTLTFHLRKENLPAWSVLVARVKRRCSIYWGHSIRRLAELLKYWVNRYPHYRIETPPGSGTLTLGSSFKPIISCRSTPYSRMLSLHCCFKRGPRMKEKGQSWKHSNGSG